MSSFFLMECLVFVVCVSLCAAESPEKIKEIFEKNKIIPDVLLNSPEEVLEVFYDEAKFPLGASLTVNETKNQPVLKWDERDAFYTVIMTDPDSPSSADPRLRELQHWIVGNVYRRNISSGQTFVEYTGPRDREEYVVEEGIHRYVLAVFEQIGKLSFAERRVEHDNMLFRGLFSTKKFVDTYRLRGPIAATFFTVDHGPITNTTRSPPTTPSSEEE